MIASLLLFFTFVSPGFLPCDWSLNAQNNGHPMQPKFLKATSGRFFCETPPTLLVGSSIGGDASPVGDALIRLRQRLGSAASARPKSKLPDSPSILIGLPKDHADLKKLKDSWQKEPSHVRLGEEGYLLKASPKRILLTADRLPGLYRGIQHLIQGIGPEGLACGTSADWPELAWRGMHVMVSGHSAMPELKRLLSDVFPALRLNRLILEINYNYPFRSHPELVRPGALTPEDCRELRKLADRNFIEIVPMINCLGHQSWDKETFALLREHPEFDETPEVPPDNKGIYCRSWCPSHPEVNRVVFALIDELIDAFQAKAFHVGMDEVFLIGKCPRCKDQSPADLFAKAVNDLHSHIVGSRHVQMLMWGDRLLDGVETKYGEWEASTNGTAPAIDRIPKDIFLCDWHYETPAEFPSIPLFQQKGFRTIPSGWNRAENVRLLTASAFRHRGSRLMGYLATTWEDVGKVVQGLTEEEPPEAAAEDKKKTNLPAAIRLGARIAWQGPRLP